MKLTKIQPKKKKAVRASDDAVQRLAQMAQENFTEAWDNPDAADAAAYERSRGFQPIGDPGEVPQYDEFGAEIPKEPAVKPAPEKVEKLVEQAVKIVTKPSR